jgi:hypothetical protein
MELTVLAVPECPTAAVLHERLAVALAGHTDISMAWHEITDEDQAAELGMHGSPTLLVNGVDPFLRAGETTSVSCRIFNDPQQNPGGTPSIARLREILRTADPRSATQRAHHPLANSDEQGARPGSCCNASRRPG